ncbi:hypothetical protein [Tannerella forsythia]|uniref:hypothetical protein n=1 Tax=Tannerella forsythia TaxID=28112 RepID=UPI00111FB1B4|nr:hypothetical protein [Tannerella forsythia]TPE17170.1 hypothetical protein FJN16_00675 [Tannerella forsythia]
MNLTIHSSFPASHRRCNDSPNSNRRDGGLGATRRPSRNIATAVSNHQDNHPELSRRQGCPIGIAGR